MNRKLQNKALFILAFIGLLSFQTNGQLYNFNTGLTDWDNFNSGAGTVTYDGAAGKTGDGALKLVRTQDQNGDMTAFLGNNAGFSYTGSGIDATTKKGIKLIVLNETKATELRLQGPNVDNVIGTVIAESSAYQTIYFDLSGEATWNDTNEVDFHILVRKEAPDATSSGEAFYVDSIEFINVVPPPTSTYAEFSGAEGADNANPGTIDPTANGNSTVTGWRFGNGTSFSDIQVFEGDYSVKATTSSNSGYLGWFYLGRSADTDPTAAKLDTGDDGVHLVILNVYVESGDARTLRCRVQNGATVLANLDWDLSGLESGKWHTIVKEMDTDAAVVDAQIAWNVENPSSGSLVLYIDGLEFISQTVGNSYKKSSIDGNWAAAFGGSAPASADRKFISSNTVVDSDITSDGDIDIANGKTLTISTGNSLTLNGNLVTSGNLILESGSQLIANGTVNGTASFTRTLPAANGADAQLDGWFSMTAPFSGGDLNTTWAGEATNNIATSVGTNKRGIAWYAEASDDWTYLLSNNSNATTFQAGRGYIVKQSTPGIITFTGTINTNDAGVAVPVTNTGGGFNLLGNPYSALINADTFITANMADLTAQEIWVWNDNGNVYNSKVNGLGANYKLAPGQAFFVQVNKATDLEFAKSNQEIGGDTFQKSAQTKITLNISNDNSHRYAEIYYIDNASKGYENGFEGRVFKGVSSNLSLYTNVIENNVGEAYQIQSLPKSDFESMVIPVGVKVAAGKEVTFTADALSLPSGIKVFLEDRVNNKFIRLDEANSNYKVTLTEALDGVGRFYLHTRSAALSTDSIELQGVSIYKSGISTIKIAGLQQGQASVSLFNIHGKQILTSSFEANNGVREISIPKVATGVYFVKLTTEKGTMNKKIILE